LRKDTKTSLKAILRLSGFYWFSIFLVKAMLMQIPPLSSARFGNFYVFNSKLLEEPDSLAPKRTYAQSLAIMQNNTHAGQVRYLTNSNTINPTGFSLIGSTTEKTDMAIEALSKRIEGSLQDRDRRCRQWTIPTPPRDVIACSVEVNPATATREELISAAAQLMQTYFAKQLNYYNTHTNPFLFGYINELRDKRNKI
jgi:hypothetical protein